jgi:hypothetical protein
MHVLTVYKDVYALNKLPNLGRVTSQDKFYFMESIIIIIFL